MTRSRRHNWNCRTGTTVHHKSYNTCIRSRQESTLNSESLHHRSVQYIAGTGMHRRGRHAGPAGGSPPSPTKALPHHIASPSASNSSISSSNGKGHGHHSVVVISRPSRLRIWWQRQIEKACSSAGVGSWARMMLLVSFVAGSSSLFTFSRMFSSFIQGAPRVVLLGETPRSVSIDGSKLHIQPGVSSAGSFQMEILVQPLESEEFYHKNRVAEDNSTTGCPYVVDGQLTRSANPTCNIQHEIGIQFGDTGLLHRLEPINSGAYKDVWKIFGEGNDEPLPAVLKTTCYDYDFLPKYLYKYRRDALVMDDTTASPFVLNMYSYCAYSSLVERAQGTLQDWLEDFYRESSQDQKSKEWYDPQHHRPPKQLLRAATMMAKGLEDTHLFTDNGLPTFAHADIKSSQFLVTTTPDDPNHPILKLNDFNRGRFLSAKDNRICPFYIYSHHRGSTNRSPEEYEDRGPQTDKIDVFSLGSTFYELLVGEAPFAYIDDYKKAIKKITDGVAPPLPASMKSTTDASLQALISVMQKCRQLSPEDRPTSREVARFLQESLETVEPGWPTKGRQAVIL